MKKALGFGAMLLVGGLVGYLGASFFLSDKGSSVYPDHYSWLVLALLPVIYLLVVGWHEMGHVTAGKLENFTFHSLTVGPLAWKREDDNRIAFRWNTNLNVSGGVAIMLPEGSENLANRFARYAAGGPVSSLLLVLLCGGLYWLLPAGSFMRLFATIVAILSGFIFVATIIPFHAGGFASDGMRMLTLWWGGPKAVADLATIRAMGILRAGQPYDQLPIKEFKAMEAEGVSTPIQRVSGYYYQYLYHLSKNEIEEAAQFLAQTMDNLSVYPKGMEGGFFLEQALFMAKYRQNLAAAEAAFAQFKPNPTVEAMSIALAKAAIADLKEDQQAVLTELPVIERGLAKTINQSRVPVIKSWLKSWKDGSKTPT